MLFLAIGLFIVVSLLSLPKQKADLTHFTSIHPTLINKPSIKNRVSYDFTKILSKDFLIYENERIGFSIKYPSQATIYKYGGDELRSLNIADQIKIVDAIDFSLTSQKVEGTELFDGLDIKLIYLENLNKLSLEQRVPQKIASDYPKEGDITSRENININNINGLKTFKCCWGGGTLSYYFPSKNNEYIIQIDIFSVGPDQEKFNLVADKIIQSFHYTP